MCVCSWSPGPSVSWTPGLLVDSTSFLLRFCEFALGPGPKVLQRFPGWALQILNITNFLSVLRKKLCYVDTVIGYIISQPFVGASSLYRPWPRRRPRPHAACSARMCPSPAACAATLADSLCASALPPRGLATDRWS